MKNSIGFSYGVCNMNNGYAHPTIWIHLNSIHKNGTYDSTAAFELRGQLDDGKHSISGSEPTPLRQAYGWEINRLQMHADAFKIAAKFADCFTLKQILNVLNRMKAVRVVYANISSGYIPKKFTGKETEYLAAMKIAKHLPRYC